MKTNLLLSIVCFSLCLLSCNNQTDKKGLTSGNNTILQEADGSISLKLEKAACYSDANDPSSNTAEWTMSISKPGRYNLWLSSATRDTLVLNYQNTVKVSFLDRQLEVDPVCDKVVQNSEGISFPFFRADSFMGSFFIQEPGDYNIQVISEKIMPVEMLEKTASLSDTTRFMSLFLVPNTR
jgi:hypothetical protein